MHKVTNKMYNVHRVVHTLLQQINAREKNVGDKKMDKRCLLIRYYLLNLKLSLSLSNDSNEVFLFVEIISLYREEAKHDTEYTVAKIYKYAALLNCSSVAISESSLIYRS